MHHARSYSARAKHVFWHFVSPIPYPNPLRTPLQLSCFFAEICCLSEQKDPGACTVQMPCVLRLFFVARTALQGQLCATTCSSSTSSCTWCSRLTAPLPSSTIPHRNRAATQQWRRFGREGGERSRVLARRVRGAALLGRFEHLRCLKSIRPGRTRKALRTFPRLASLVSLPTHLSSTQSWRM